MPKFYTPHIDEFREGFVYYCGDQKQTFSIENQFAQFYNEQKPVIKFLDTEDILEMDFQLVTESSDTKTFKRLVQSVRSTSVVELSLTYIGETPIIAIDVEDEVILSPCICKNKFELEFMLNRLRL